MTKHPVEGHPHLSKDMTSGVVSNRNTTERERYHLMKRTHQINSETRTEVDELKSEISELKSLVKQLLENNGS